MKISGLEARFFYLFLFFIEGREWQDWTLTPKMSIYWLIKVVNWLINSIRLQLINWFSVQILVTYPCATFSNYQNALIHISELKTHPTFISCAIKKYELQWGPLGPLGQYQLPQNLIFKLTNILIQRVNCILVLLCIL